MAARVPRKPKAAAAEKPVEDVTPAAAEPAVTEAPPKAIVKAKAKGKAKAKAAPATPPVTPAAAEKPVAPTPAPRPVEEAPRKHEVPLSPEDAKIAQYFQNPKSKVSGRFRTKVSEWITMYETIGSAHEVWKKPNPMAVWETPKHEFHGTWNQFMEGMTVSDAEALVCLAIDNRVTALEQMLVSWIALKLRSVVGQPDLMVKMLEGNA